MATGNGASDQVVYIQLLQERNRILRRLKSKPVSKEAQELKEKEEGFNVYLNGANEERIKDERLRKQMKPKVPRCKPPFFPAPLCFWDPIHRGFACQASCSNVR